MYEKPYLHIILFPDEDIVRTSNVYNDSWSDDNVDVNGWT